MSRCNQTCVNTFGSFRCECHHGYISRDQGRICEGNWLTREKILGDPWSWRAGATAFSDNGKLLNTEINGWNHCRHGQIQTSLCHFFPDVNECQEAGNLMNNCSENAMCMNFPGSYNCSCNPGYEGDPYSNCTGEWIYTSEGFQVNFLLLKG